MVSAQVSGRFVLDVAFDDGMRRKVDIETELLGPVFLPLRGCASVAQVPVVPVSGTVVRPNEPDFSPEFLPAATNELLRRLARVGAGRSSSLPRSADDFEPTRFTRRRSTFPISTGERCRPRTLQRARRASAPPELSLQRLPPDVHQQR